MEVSYWQYNTSMVKLRKIPLEFLRFLPCTVSWRLTVCGLFGPNVSGWVTSQYKLWPLLLVSGLQTRVPVTLYVFEVWSYSDLVVTSVVKTEFSNLMDIVCSGKPPKDTHVHVSGVLYATSVLCEFVVGPVNVGGCGVAVNWIIEHYYLYTFPFKYLFVFEMMQPYLNWKICWAGVS